VIEPLSAVEVSVVATLKKKRKLHLESNMK